MNFTTINYFGQYQFSIPVTEFDCPSVMHNQLCNEILIANGVDTTRLNTREPSKGSRRRNSEVSRVKMKQLLTLLIHIRAKKCAK
jgi:hypothetical protein